MAEILVRAKGHWMDDLSPSVVNKMSADEKESYEARFQLGDIVVVRENGWEWGSSECLPNFIVIKITNLDYESAKYLEDALLDSESIPKKHRKWAVPKQVVNNYISLNQDVVEITLTQQQQEFINNLIEKTI